MFLSKFFEPKPFNQGYLPEVDGHRVFFMEFGNPKGEVILTTHGGPGGCFKSKHVKRYNLRKFRLIAFDQRGCGKSLPLGEIKHNNTQKTIDDMKRLLEHLGIKEKVIVAGASWASTLALLFAIKNPDRVSKLALSAIFIPGSEYCDWMEKDTAKIYPDIMDEIKKNVKGELRGYYKKLINSDNIGDQYKAASLYGSYERQLGSLNPQIGDGIFTEQDIQSIRMFINYDEQNCYAEDGDIFDNLDKIKHIPALIVHNRLDLVCPLQGAWKLHKGLPDSKMVIVPELGHGGKLMNKIAKRKIAEFLEG